jgi:hypothetical protein
MTVLDLSNYDVPTFNTTCFKDNGVTGVILGAGLRDQAIACRDAGITIHGFYGFVYFGDAFGEARDTALAIKDAQEFGVRRVWLDCETDANKNGWNEAPTPTPEQRVAAIRTQVAAIEAAGLEAGIYTGGWWWPSGTDKSTEFARLPLWHSQYADEAGTYSEVRDVSYGGWTTVAIHQWTSTREVCGRNRDHNTIWEDELDSNQLAMLDHGEKAWKAMFAGDDAYAGTWLSSGAAVAQSIASIEAALGRLADAFTGADRNALADALIAAGNELKAR